MHEPRRRLTPLESEMTASHRPTVPGKPSLMDRLRRRRARRVPTTVAGAVAQGLIRLAIVAAVASGIALAVDHWTHRETAFGFYIVGAAVLATAFGLSAADVSSPRHYGRGERERRVSMSFSYVLAGAVVIAIGVAVEQLG